MMYGEMMIVGDDPGVAASDMAREQAKKAGYDADLFTRVYDRTRELRSQLEADHPDKLEKIRDIFDASPDAYYKDPGYYAMEIDGEIRTFKENDLVWDIMIYAQAAFNEADGDLEALDYDEIINPNNRFDDLLT